MFRLYEKQRSYFQKLPGAICCYVYRVNHLKEWPENLSEDGATIETQKPMEL